MTSRRIRKRSESKRIELFLLSEIAHFQRRDLIEPACLKTASFDINQDVSYLQKKDQTVTVSMRKARGESESWSLVSALKFFRGVNDETELRSLLEQNKIKEQNRTKRQREMSAFPVENNVFAKRCLALEDKLKEVKLQVEKQKSESSGKSKSGPTVRVPWLSTSTTPVSNKMCSLAVQRSLSLARMRERFSKYLPEPTPQEKALKEELVIDDEELIFTKRHSALQERYDGGEPMFDIPRGH